MKSHTFTEHNINCGSCPECNGHAFERLKTKNTTKRVVNTIGVTWYEGTISLWKCLSCGAKMWGNL